MNSPRTRRSTGFTLAETLVAGIILAGSAAVLGLAVRQNAQGRTAARNAQRAAELLDRVLTKIDAIGPARLMEEGPTEGTFAPPYDRFSWAADMEPNLTGYLYTVTVRVSWRDAMGQEHSADAQTMLNDPPGSRSDILEWDDL